MCIVASFSGSTLHRCVYSSLVPRLHSQMGVEKPGNETSIYCGVERVMVVAIATWLHIIEGSEPE